MQPCQDDYSTTFSTFDAMKQFHIKQASSSEWKRAKVSSLKVAPLDNGSDLYMDRSSFDSTVSPEAIEDTSQNMKLAMVLGATAVPLRTTAYKSLLDRAKISGSVLPKLPKKLLASVLNQCLQVHMTSDALLLIREQKVSAVHSGDAKDYSILPIDELLTCLQEELDARFPNSLFEKGYSDHSLTSATWCFPDQKDALIGAYRKTLEDHGKKAMADKFMPGIRFLTSDTGVSAANISAMLFGTQIPIRVGSILGVEHRGQKTISNFKDNLTMMFAKFNNTILNLEKLLDVELSSPINAMTAVCKKLALPKKPALEAIAMLEMALCGSPATAHDVFMGLQEIMFICKTSKMPHSKLLGVEESLARALTLRWDAYDSIRKVDY